MALVDMMLKGPDGTTPHDPPDDRAPTPAEVSARRASVMESWFPHTLAICRSGGVPTISSLIASGDFAEWQVVQAACYLSAANALGSHPTAVDLAEFLHHYREQGAGIADVGTYLSSLARRAITEQVRRNNLYLAQSLALFEGKRPGGRELQLVIARWSVT